MARDAELDRLMAERIEHMNANRPRRKSKKHGSPSTAGQALDRLIVRNRLHTMSSRRPPDDYQRVRSQLGPRIDQLNSLQETAFRSMKAALDRASSAYDGSSRLYADEGHHRKAEAQEALAERRRLVGDIRNPRDRHERTKPAFERAKADFDRLSSAHDRGKADHEQKRVDFQAARLDNGAGRGTGRSFQGWGYHLGHVEPPGLKKGTAL